MLETKVAAKIANTAKIAFIVPIFLPAFDKETRSIGKLKRFLRVRNHQIQVNQKIRLKF
jgi:hypothetical protein